MKSKKKFAMMMMDAQYDTKRDYAVFETEEVETHMITVNSPEQAVQMAKELAEQGFGAIEVSSGSKRTVRSFLAGITT